MSTWKETEIGILPADAELVELDSCLSLIIDHRGKTPKKMGGDWVDTGVRAISAKNVHGGKLTNQGDIRYVTNKMYLQWMKEDVKKGDCLLVSEGATLGEHLYWDFDFPVVLSQRLFCIRTNHKKLHPKYFYAFVTSNYFQNQIDGRASGTSVFGLRQTEVRRMLVSLIPIDRQKVIGEIHYSLNKKIDLLHRQNKTLEAMAETLFRQWFVEEAEEGWETRPLGNLVTVKRGGSPRPIQEYLSETGLRWLKISDATKEGSPFVFEIKEHIKESGLTKTTLLKAGALVLSNSATPGIPKILQVDTCIHDGWLHFPESYFSNEFLYLLFKMIRPELVMQGNGSIFTNLKTDILKEYRIPIPSKSKLNGFQRTIERQFIKILTNATQIRTLESLRDILLPKLISGEVRVKI
ncbi:MAG: restriction endonuclease subunit S [Chitinispirillaceae bacterium]|nr:restriction endonuclease subunit S [Chitinispirillaceae bacterium]